MTFYVNVYQKKDGEILYGMRVNTLHRSVMLARNTTLTGDKLLYRVKGRWK